MKQKRAALYVRVSSGEQHTEAQERALRDQVQRRGWLQHKIYRDKRTGGTRKPTRSRRAVESCRRPSH
jgi:DNA invertase Pin-like site-specific DNA recombinase